MRKVITLMLICFSLLGCRQSMSDTGTLSSEQDTIGKQLLDLAKEDLERTQKATFNIFTDSIPANRYVADTTHSSVQFNVRHWGIYDLIGRFDSYEIVLYYDRDDFTDMVVEARLRSASINMPNKKMENHLKGDNFGFFEASKYPTVVYKSSRMKMVSDSLYEMTGDMTIKEITKEVVFNIRFNGFASDFDRSIPGFTINGRINRMDFKLGGTEVLPGNGLPNIGNEVFITSNIRLIRDYD